MPQPVTCIICGTTVFRTPAKAAKSKFCSNRCSAKFSVSTKFSLGFVHHKAIAALRATEVTRFWARVAKGRPDECWEWTGHRNAGSYGEVSWRGQRTLAHRVAMAMSDGDWESRLHVCHTCDNPPCCNPAHLFRGTDQDNTDDRIRKGRVLILPQGELNHKARATNAIVTAIRQSTLSNYKLAKQYGLGSNTVRAIRNRLTWRHLP